MSKYFLANNNEYIDINYLIWLVRWTYTVEWADKLQCHFLGVEAKNLCPQFALNQNCHLAFKSLKLVELIWYFSAFYK